MLKAITALLLFIGTQLVCSALALLWLNADRISAGQPLDYGLLLQQPAASGVALFWGSLLLIGLLTATRVARRSSLQSLCQLPPAYRDMSILAGMVERLRSGEPLEHRGTYPRRRPWAG